jgi:hypothetical protein
MTLVSQDHAAATQKPRTLFHEILPESLLSTYLERGHLAHKVETRAPGVIFHPQTRAGNYRLL